MRNVFDQYRHAENRLTHAFFTALDRDRALLADFLKRFVPSARGQKAPSLSISVQTIPGMPELSEQDESDRRGIPDAWIHNGEDWCLVVEAKINAPLTADQLRRHIRIAGRLGFMEIAALAITAHSTPVETENGTIPTTWSRLYRWLKAHPESIWAQEAAGYFEDLEARMIGEENFSSGTLTEFAGFPFKKASDYSYLEARRVLRLAMDALRGDARLEQLGVTPSASGRKAITGKDEDNVWDYLSLRSARNAASHTNHLHLTLGVSHRIEPMVTIPNAINTPFRRSLIELEEEGFRNLVQTILSNMETRILSKEGFAIPTIRAIQRRYRTQRSVPFVDGLIDFDMRTAFADKAPVKQQPQWLSSVFEAFTGKQSNLQVQIGVKFEVARCPTMQTADALELIAEAWLACKPLVDYDTTS